MKVRVRTPEAIELEYDVAGLGTRTMACLIDTSLQALAVYVIYLILVAMGVLTKELNLASTFGLSTLWFTALAVLVFYAISAGYFIIFEWLWHGQTPGKRLLKIRVMKDDGNPIGFLESMIRNALRMIDALPGNYALGATVLLLSPEDKRIGDHVAGTMVVEDTKPTALQELPLPPGESVRVARVDRVTSAEIELVREFLERKEHLAPESSARLALMIAAPLMKKLEVSPEDFPDPTTFLVQLYRSYRQSSSPTQL